jgi:YVTN family beta-propeller protein
MLYLTVLAALLFSAVHPPMFMSTRGYVANFAANSVSVIGLNDNTVLATVPVGARPIAIAVINTSIYVANSAANSVSVIDGNTNTVAATIPVGSAPSALVFRDGFLYVANAASNTVSVIDIASNTITATIPVGKHPSAIAANTFATDGSIYVANRDSNSVSVISTATNKVTATITVGTHPAAIAFDTIELNPGAAVSPTRTAGFIANSGGNTISVIDPASNTVTNTIRVGQNPSALYAGFGYAPRAGIPTKSLVFAVNSGANSVSVIDAFTNAVDSTIRVGPHPTSIAVNAGRAWVTNAGSNTVSAIDIYANKITATIPVGSAPAAIALGGQFWRKFTPSSRVPR